LQAIRLLGTQNLRIERVNVINAASKSTKGAVILCDTSQSALSPASGILVSECEISSYQGGDCWAIKVFGKTQAGSETSRVGKASGIIEKCIVKFPASEGSAYNLYGASGFIVRNNRSYNGSRAFNNDSGYSEYLIVQDNIFVGAQHQNDGAITIQAAERSLLQNNLVEI